MTISLQKYVMFVLPLMVLGFAFGTVAITSWTMRGDQEFRLKLVIGILTTILVVGCVSGIIWG